MFDISGLSDIGEQNCDVKHKQSQLIGVDSVTWPRSVSILFPVPICDASIKCFRIIFQRHQVRKGQTKNIYVSST